MTPAKQVTILDLVDDDQRCIAVDGFRPVMSREIERGESFPLSHPLVRAFSQFFVIAIPVGEVLNGEIERGE